MALIKNKEIAGITANYHRIIEFSTNVDSNKTVVTLAVYVSKVIRTANANNKLRVERIELNNIYENRTAVYTALKALPAFTGSTDDLS